MRYGLLSETGDLASWEAEGGSLGTAASALGRRWGLDPRPMAPWSVVAGWGRFARNAMVQARSKLAAAPRSHSYPVLGAGLALTAPLGLLVLRAVAGGRSPQVASVMAIGGQVPLTYAYVTLGTLAAFASLGWLLGRSFDRVRVLSLTDPLTGVFNRRSFTRRLSEELQRGKRHGHPTSMLCVDVDHLKTINDEFGHRGGDCALVHVCQALSRSARTSDLVARLGGDEFAVLLPATSALQASALASRILIDLGRDDGASAYRPSISIGIAELEPTKEPDAEALLDAADAALYRAKATGGGRAVVAGPRGAPSRLRRGDILLAIAALCAACHGDRDVRACDAADDTGFCGECRERASGPSEEYEPGGQG